jgi:hypothetical protein
MEGSDPRPASVVALDELIRRFAEGGYAPTGADVEDDPHDGHRHGSAHATDGSVREFTHRGHAVRLVTRYEVTIDGERWDQQIRVQNDGNVTYHGLPQYVVPSAVDLVRGVIDHSYEAPEEIRSAIRAAQGDA